MSASASDVTEIAYSQVVVHAALVLSPVVDDDDLRFDFKRLRLRVQGLL